jgi:LEA14-like dessication related protein
MFKVECPAPTWMCEQLMILKRLVLFVLLASLSACAGMGSDLQAPRLSIVAASMTSADMFSQQFRVRIRAENPNARALPIKSIEYKLFLEGDDFAEGASMAPFSVPANGEQEFDLAVRTHFSSSIARLLSRLTGSNRSKIAYAFTGTVTLDMTFSPKLKFAESGEVDLARR